MEIMGDWKKSAGCKCRMNGKRVPDGNIGGMDGTGWEYKVNERKQPNGRKEPDERKVAGEDIRRIKERYRMGITGE